VSYIMCYIILWMCLTHSWQIQWILWIGKKEIIEVSKNCFYVTFLQLKRKMFTIFCVLFTLDSLKKLAKSWKQYYFQTQSEPTKPPSPPKPSKPTKPPKPPNPKCDQSPQLRAWIQRLHWIPHRAFKRSN